jgi:hypothetical protein
MTSNRTRGVLDGVNAAELPGVHLSAAEFDILIVSEGTSGELRRAVICPCVRIDIRTPDVSCSVCHGMGRTYPASMREPLIWLDSERSTTTKLASIGQIPDGTIRVTFPSGVVPAFGDMLLPDGEIHVVTETLFRDGSRRTHDVDLRPYRPSADQVKPAQNPRAERLLYHDPCCIEFVAYRRDGQLCEANSSEYTIDADGRWTWRGDAGPEIGHAWTVRYRAPAIYLVHTSAPRYRSSADARMPHLVTARRLDIVSSEDLRQ